MFLGKSLQKGAIILQKNKNLNWSSLSNCLVLKKFTYFTFMIYKIRLIINAIKILFLELISKKYIYILFLFTSCGTKVIKQIPFKDQIQIENDIHNIIKKRNAMFNEYEKIETPFFLVLKKKDTMIIGQADFYRDNHLFNNEYDYYGFYEKKLVVVWDSNSKRKNKKVFTEKKMINKNMSYFSNDRELFLKFYKSNGTYIMDKKVQGKLKEILRKKDIKYKVDYPGGTRIFSVAR